MAVKSALALTSPEMVVAPAPLTARPFACAAVSVKVAPLPTEIELGATLAEIPETFELTATEPPSIDTVPAPLMDLLFA